MRKALILIFAVTCLLPPRQIEAQEKADIKTIEGVRHILNSEKPLHGTIQLEIEKILTINPYDFPDFGMRWFSFVRAQDGGVILYDPNRSQAHRFGPKGESHGSFIKNGQGPGEFSPGSIFQPYFLDGRIWATGRKKLAEFDANGKFVREQTLSGRPKILIDETSYIAERSVRNNDQGNQTTVISMMRMTKESFSDVPETNYIESRNVGMLGDANRGFAESWGTPNICFAYDRNNRKIYVALNTEYKIFVKTLKGETLAVIQKTHKPVKVGRKDVEILLGPRPNNAPVDKWMVDLYPDRLVALNQLQTLPNGCLLVWHVSGLKKLEIDVFNADGQYLYALHPPAGKSFEGMVFHGRGFAVIESAGDYLIYVDYRITNLPDIFEK